MLNLAFQQGDESMEGIQPVTQEGIGRDFIDLEKVIEAKNPVLLKTIPGFAIRYLKRVIHQDEINKALYTHRELCGLEFIRAILDEFRANIILSGQENIPAQGRVIIAGNHPLGGLDGLALMEAVGRTRTDIVFPVNDLLMNVPNLKELFIPINKHGSNASNVAVIEDTFASEKALLYFPAGLCSRKRSGKIVDLEWKKSFISKARKHRRDIIPVHISGRNSDFFYNLSNFRSFIGLKANIEMLYLVDEMYRQRDREIRITFGKPVSHEVFDRSNSDKAWANLLRSHVYRLEHEPSAVFLR